MMVTSAESLKAHLAALKRLRGAGHTAPARLVELKAFQAERLREWYLDLAAQPRYEAATSFFLEDLYGTKDFSARDQDMLRILPVMTRVLPESAVETAALSIELDALSEQLDQRVARALPPDPIDAATYGEAYRAGSTRAERERQVELVMAVGQRVDRLVQKPVLLRTLKLMRRPAALAGLQTLQDFLERGVDSFRVMHGAEEFLATIHERETLMLNRLFSGEAVPSSPAKAPSP